MPERSTHRPFISTALRIVGATAVATTLHAGIDQGRNHTAAADYTLQTYPQEEHCIKLLEAQGVEKALIGQRCKLWDSTSVPRKTPTSNYLPNQRDQLAAATLINSDGDNHNRDGKNKNLPFVNEAGEAGTIIALSLVAYGLYGLVKKFVLDEN